MNSIRKVNKGNRLFKYIIPGLVIFLLIVIVLGVFINPKMLLGSVYSIYDLDDNINNIKVGDTINYEINGHSGWKVLSIDKDNGTLDLVSDEDTGSIMLKGGSESDYYLGVLQSEADKFYDNKYVTNVRSVNYSDLVKFDYDSDFWTSDIDNNIIKTSKGFWINDLYTSDIYLIPMAYYGKNNHDDCFRDNKSFGDYCDISIIGINGWIYLSDASYAAWGDYKSSVIPKVPIKVVVDDEDYDVDKYVNDFLNSFPSTMGGTRGQNYIGNNVNFNQLYNLFSDFFDSQENDIIIYVGNGINSNCYKSENGNEIICNSYLRYSVDSGSLSYSGGSIYQANKVTKGFRPVITISFDKREKKLDTGLKVGDNVKYSYNGYRDWKVLSIDEENNTADVISGGVLKNISLSGIDDYDNYEEILQGEIEQYMSDDVLSVRLVEKSDISILNQINDRILASYFINNKSEYNGDTYSLDQSGSATIVAKYISTSSFNSSVSENIINQNILVVDFVGDERTVYYYLNNYYPAVHFESNGINYSVGEYSCTSGIRPVLTLKLSEVEKISDEEEIKNIENHSYNVDKKIYDEQTKSNSSSISSSKSEKSNISNNKSGAISDNTTPNSNLDNSKNVTSNSSLDNSTDNNSIDNKLMSFNNYIIFFIILLAGIVIVVVCYLKRAAKDVNKK